MSWVSQYIPEAILIIVLLIVGSAISIIGFTAYLNLLKAVYRMGIAWSMPVRYGNGWLIEVSVFHNPVLGGQLMFTTLSGIQPGTALECGTYVISSIRAYYCIYNVSAYPIMPLLTR